MEKMDQVLKGKVTVITSAGRGIGNAIAIAFAKAGSSVVCASRTLSEIEETVRLIPFLKQRGAGKIITIGSGLGHHGFSAGSAYSCSKAGLWMLTRILAQELLPYNISVSELIPGPVLTSIDDNDQ